MGGPAIPMMSAIGSGNVKSVKIDRCILRNNYSMSGGGFNHNNTHKVIIENTIVKNNSADEMGAGSNFEC